MPGKCLSIPAYWWHSIQFGQDSSVTVLSYRTYMNNVAILPSTLMYWLQNQNIKREVVKKINVEKDLPKSVTTTTTTAIPVEKEVITDEANISDLINL